MTVRAAVAVALLASGCTLYFGGDEPSPNPSTDAPWSTQTDAPPFPQIDAPPRFSVTPLALPCIHDVAGGQLFPSTNVLHVIRACEGGPIISQVDIGYSLTESNPRADWRHQYRHAKVVNSDSRGGLDIVTTSDNGLDAGLFWTVNGPGWNWRSLQFYRPFLDLSVGDLAPIGPHPVLVAAGDRAVRLVLQTESYAPSFPFDIPVNTEREIANGRDFVRVAVAELNGDSARDIFYVARTSASVELGALLQTASSPPTFTVQPLRTGPVGATLPLLVGDVDGDNIDDVIGAAPEVFVRSSRLGTIGTMDEEAADIAIGDLDADGTRDVLFITADQSEVRRLRVDASGASLVLSTQQWLNAGGSRIVMVNLDGDSRDDFVLLRGRGLPSSTLVPVLTP